MEFVDQIKKAILDQERSNLIKFYHLNQNNKCLLKNFLELTVQKIKQDLEKSLHQEELLKHRHLCLLALKVL